MTQGKAVLILSGLCVFFVAMLSGTELFHKAESHLVDLRYLLRSRQQAPAQAPQICLITINNQTGKDWEEHHFFWTRYYARATRAALDSGASCVGLDMVLTYPDPEGSAELLQTAIEHRGKLVLGAYLEPGRGELLAPFAKLTAAAGAENVALLNLWRDWDGVVRAQPVEPITLKALGRDSIPPIAGRLAEIHGGSADAPTVSPSDPRMRINFTTPHAFPEVPIQQVLEWLDQGQEARLRETFEGRVVLLGSVRSEDKDAVETPLSLQEIDSPELGRTLSVTTMSRRASMPGVLVHAHTLRTLLEKDFVKTASPLQELGLMLCFALLVGFLGLRFSPPVTVAVLLVVFSFYGSACYLAFRQSSWLLPMLGPGMLVGLQLGTIYGYRYLFAERQRQQLRRTFSRYVASEVMEEMLKFPEQYDPSQVTEREVTVFFSDITGFSTVCEGHSAVEVTQMLDTHFKEMSEIIFANQGTLIRFSGDEFMVLFGAPRATEQPEQAAVRTALMMVERLEEMKKADPSGENGFYQVKIGIHSGKMILTSIGTDKRSDYNAIGDGANLASRVMSLAPQAGVSILVSQRVVDRAGEMNDVEFLSKGTHPVKGRAGEVTVYTPRKKAQ